MAQGRARGDDFLECDDHNMKSVCKRMIAPGGWIPGRRAQRPRANWGINVSFLHELNLRKACFYVNYSTCTTSKGPLCWQTPHWSQSENYGPTGLKWTTHTRMQTKKMSRILPPSLKLRISRGWQKTLIMSWTRDLAPVERSASVLHHKEHCRPSWSNTWRSRPWLWIAQ